MKTLTCKGPPEHTFEHPGGRGRPPSFCPEHKPVKKASSNSSVTGVTGVTAKSEAPVNPFIQKAQKEANRKKTEPARAQKQAKAQERAHETAEAIEKEYIEIDDRITRATMDYDNSLKATKDIDWSRDVEEEFNKAWRICDRKMVALMSLLNRRRYLEAIVETLTNPDTPERIVEHPAGACRHCGSTAHWTGEHDSEVRAGVINEDELESASELLDDAQEDESALGYNDLLSNPEQYDEDNDVADQFASILREFED